MFDSASSGAGVRVSVDSDGLSFFAAATEDDMLDTVLLEGLVIAIAPDPEEEDIDRPEL